MCAKFEVSSFNSCLEMQGSQNSKSRSREPFKTLFDIIILFSPPVVNRQSYRKLPKSNSVKEVNLQYSIEISY